MKKQRHNRRSGHCFGAGPMDLLFLLGLGLMSIIAPIATFIKIIVSFLRNVTQKQERNKTNTLLPVIKGPLILPEELNIIEVTTNVTEAHCPVCATSLTEEDTISCQRCETPHHKDCWEFNGACAVYGCGIEKISIQPESTNKKTTSPADEPLPHPDFPALRRRFRRWFWIVRIQWWSVLWLCFGAASGFLLYALGAGSRAIVDFLLSTGIVVFGLALVLWLISKFTRWKLESTNERLPLVPPQRMATLLKRVENSQSRPLIEKFVERAPYLYALLGLLPLVRVQVKVGSFLLLVYTVMVLLWGGFFIWMAKIATKRHRADLERVRCRLRGAAKI